MILDQDLMYQYHQLNLTGYQKILLYQDFEKEILLKIKIFLYLLQQIQHLIYLNYQLYYLLLQYDLMIFFNQIWLNIF